jgi:LysR family transcriptional regulator, carnitine catabolism transcriptional activator
MDLTLRQLEIYAEVARTRSFTRAASELMLSQPVISRTIGEIERKLATPLLERTTRSVELTEAGREFLNVALGILDSYRRGLSWFDDYRDGERKQVTIATLPSIAAAVLPAILAGYLGENPGIQIRLLDGTNDQIIADLQSGAADFAISETGPAAAPLAHTPLLDDPLVAVLAHGHRHLEREQVSWQDLSSEPFIAFSPGSSIRRLTDLGFAQSCVQSRQFMETRTVATAGALIAADLGVSAVPRLVLPLMAATPVASRLLGAPAVTRHIALHQRAGERAPAAVQRLIDRIVETAGTRSSPTAV